ncbi:MAG: hypothetical protein M1816_007295 [Peltula sp. TS41687]|nr:MAG: hypothetical protein M1816_007295 [Peltula sp. TS41687]
MFSSAAILHWSGPVVRTAPNELSFNTSTSWTDIYDFRQGHRPFVKSKFYEGGTFADQCGSIVSERDPAVHGTMRRSLSHAFSQRSLMEQEHLIARVIDRFIDRVGQLGGGEEGIDIVQWYNMMTFDIIGDLAFGETFNGIESALGESVTLESGTSTTHAVLVSAGETHPWIARITGAMTQGALADCFKRFPMIAKFVLALVPGMIERIIADTKINERYAIDLVKKRINRRTDRHDFLTRIIELRDPTEVSDVQIAAHASDFVLAGSETTATCLSCITYYLLHEPDITTKLQEEIRTAFRSYSEINAASTAALKYLNAVILEGLRIYPPLPFALPRLVPEGGDTVDGHFLPAGTVVSTNPIAACLDPANFNDPLSFRPERWMDENHRDALGASQPFSLGPRGCIGRSLGWMELRTTLAKLHYVYDLELLSKDIDWQRDSRMHTLWLKPALQVKVVSRGSKATKA